MSKMAKRDSKKARAFQLSMKEALESFDLNKFKAWMQKYNKPLWNTFKKSSETVQMATMCKMICNRTDLLGTEVHKQARVWLREHNMRGQIF